GLAEPEPTRGARRVEAGRQAFDGERGRERSERLSETCLRARVCPFEGIEQSLGGLSRATFEVAPRALCELRTTHGESRRVGARPPVAGEPIGDVEQVAARPIARARE